MEDVQACEHDCAQESDLDSLHKAIDDLLEHAVCNLLLNESDVDWMRNQIFAVCDLDSYSGKGRTYGQRVLDIPNNSDAYARTIDDLLERFLQACCNARVIQEDERGQISDRIMGLLTARPSRLAREFAKREHESGSSESMQWFYDYCVSNTYVKRSVLQRNPRFNSHGLIVTINLAKPEFADPKKAASGNSMASGYPKCTICHENEGFAGRNKRTLRTIPVTLDGDPWFWQFSPYGYFDQHGICVNAEHTPMHVDARTFIRLMDFVDRFPRYFLGCNAALPRIGGSVLGHDHYQGGGEYMPMHHAQAWKTLIPHYVQESLIEILDWPGTALRIVSRSRNEVAMLSEMIRKAWVAYDNPSLGIVSRCESGQQSALSPSVVMTSRGYEMNLILRNNAVSEDFPEGVFHAHPDFHPVKREAIGLIEAQGMFILPGRLVQQLEQVERAIVDSRPLGDEVAQFSLEYEEVCQKLNGERSEQAVHEAMKDELGSVCERILENTAVFKRKEETELFLRNVVFTQ